MIEMIALLIIIGIIIGATAMASITVPRLIDKRGQKNLPYAENYLAFDLDLDDFFLPREDAPDYVFKGQLLAEKRWKDRTYVEEWFQFYKLNDGRYLANFRSKEKDGWKYWKNHPLVLTKGNLQGWLYGASTSGVKNPRAQTEAKALIKVACQYDDALKDILFERIAT